MITITTKNANRLYQIAKWFITSGCVVLSISFTPAGENFIGISYRVSRMDEANTVGSVSKFLAT